MKKVILPLFLSIIMLLMVDQAASAGAEGTGAVKEPVSVFRGLRWGQSLESVLLDEIKKNEMGDRPLIDIDRVFKMLTLVYTPFGSGPNMPLRVAYYFDMDEYPPTVTYLRDVIVSLRVPLGSENAERAGRIIGLDLQPCQEAAECLKMVNQVISARYDLKPAMCDGEPTWDVNGVNYINAKVAVVPEATNEIATVPGTEVTIYYSYWPIGGGCAPEQ